MKGKSFEQANCEDGHIRTETDDRKRVRNGWMVWDCCTRRGLQRQMRTQTTLDSCRYASPPRLAVTVLALCIAFTMAAAPSAGVATDRDVLVALYQAANGANWKNNANWLSDAPLATWHGVTTDDSGRVIALDLSENGLSGAIPPELGNLTNLTALNLYPNDLSGDIPSELGNLTNLEFLDLAGNRLSGTIPSELGNLTNLRQLSLAGNDLSGVIPPGLGQLTNLKWLYLHENDLSGTIPSELGQLTSLESLGLWNNDLSGAIPPGLGQLTNLRLLDLSGNRLSGTIPSELGQLTELKVLYLSENALSGCVPELWRNVEENDLAQLGLPFCSAATDREALVALYQATHGANWENNANWLSAAPLDTWRGVTTGENGRVIALDLSENRVSGEIPPELGQLTNLTWLNLDSNQLNGSIPSELGNLNNLEFLILGDNQLSGDIPSALGQLTNLTWLDLAGNELRGCVPEIWRNVEKNDLQSLGLPFCVAPSPTSTAPTAKTTPAAEEITLNTPVEMPRAMLFAAYAWPVGTAIDEILVSFTVDNDVELGGNHGLYFIACTAFSIAGDGAYFGLQTDVNDPARGNLGKGAIFSRWYENDETAAVRLADTRVPERGWTESGDYEGNFVSVRGRFQWGAGDYTLKVAAQEADNVGQWYGLWVIDGSGKETWIGSLRFSPGARIDPVCYSTVDVYGGPPLKPANLPYWKVSVNPPTGNGIPAALVDTWYPQNVESLRNALITVNGARVTFEVGLDYIAHE